MLGGDRRLVGVMGTTLIYVLCTLAIFNVGYALLLRCSRPPCRSAPAPSSAPSGSCRA